MKTMITLRDASLGEAARSHAEEKIQSLQRYFERITSVEVILGVETNHTKTKCAEFVVHANRGAVLVARAEDGDIRKATDRAYAEVKRELLRHKERLTDHHRARRASAERKTRIS